MKKIFTHLFAVLLLSLVTTSAWAQETTEISLKFNEGTCTSTTSFYCSGWVSNTEPTVTLSVASGKNNLVVAPSSGSFELHEGSDGSDWNLSVDGYVILSYSFKYKTKESGNNVTITANGTPYTSSDTEQQLNVTGLSSSSVSFNLNGNNKGIIVTDFKLVVRPPLALTSLEVGQVYRFENVLYPGYSLNANSATDVNSVTTSETDTKQQWYVERQDGEYYVLRNLAYGKFLKGSGQSSAWGMSDDYSHDYNKFKLYTSNTDYNTLHTNTLANYAYIHCNSSYNIVGWSNGTTDKGSHWEITKVDYTAEEITALLETAPTVAEVAAYLAALEAIFSDAACTILNSEYTTTSMTDEQLATDANYSALPQTLKNMVKKVRNDEWSEATIAPASRPNGNNNDNHDLWTVEDTWDDDYAKKFRVQMYEPYSVEGEITTFLGINAHCNMDNPTGIYANAGEPIYIMVEGDIAEGAELWMAHQTGHGVTNYYNNAAYTQLKKGLNVIPYASDGCQLWINYLVHTYNTSTGEFSNKLSDYKPLKIHIEGGHINGFFNAMGDFRSTEVTGDANGGENLWGEVDNDADWDYYKARAALATDFALLGHRQTLLFPFGTWNSSNGYFGVANDDGGIEKALAWHLENIEVPTTPNCYAGSGNAFGDFSNTYYPGMNLDAETGKINIMLEAWDRIMYSEHATMGLLGKSNIDKMNSLYPGWTAENTTFDIYNYGSNDTGDTYKAFCEGRDYSDYYNHHGAAVGSGTGYMSGGWRVCNYHYNTMGSIIGKIAVEAGPTWGPAHEIGHQHQKIFNLNGQTEVTNNFFSNVAVWYMGMGTSRVNGTDGSLASVLDAFNTEDNDLYTNNIWAMTHLYYRLWLYYHLAGNNTQFWPRLFELLRQTPMVNGGQISGETSLLRFYQHACDAAGEDLTEFFRAHGFFELMTNRFVGDYSNATYNVTEEQIETAITAVKEKNYPVNYAVLLINDATSEKTVKHDGASKRALWDSEPSAEYGSVTDFIDGDIETLTNYTATVSADGTVTMSGGEGGIGFLVFNENGELVSFSNKSTFELGDEAAYLLATGKASIVAVDTESTTTEAEVDVTAMRFALLQELIENAIALTQNTSETRVGFYKPSAVTNLQIYVTKAQEVVANGDLANLQAVYELLYAEYNAVVANEFSRVTFVPGSKYAILAKTNDRILSFSGTTVVTVAATEDYASTANNQWYVERDGAFHIKNAGNSKYIQNVTDQNGVLYTVGDEVVNMNINEIQLGCYSIATSTVPGRYMNMDGGNNARVITWGDTGNNSQWKFILLEENETNATKEELLELSKKTLTLVNEVATVSYNEGSKITLQSDDNTAVNYIWSNAAVSGNNVDKLLDGNKDSFFHSQWGSTTAPSDGWGHHLTVDLGDTPSLTSFKFKFTTRNESGLSNYPKTIEVYGSNIGGDDVANYTKLQVTSGFATGAGVDNEAVVMGNGTAYRYLRFLVTDATGSNGGTNTGSDGMVFFHMSEFSIYPVTVSATVKSDYTSGVTVDAVLAAYNDAEQGKTVYNNASATLADINAKKTALGDGTAAGSYTTLLNQYNSVLNSVLDAKKEQLQKLIDETNTLIGSVGSVTIVPPTENELSLQVDNVNGSYYLSTNSQENGDNRNIKNLVDGITDNSDLYFHTNWQKSVGADHHLLLDMGVSESIGKFAFKYTTRNNSAGIDAPTSMVVEGSNDNSLFEEIATLAGLPTGQHETYESAVLGSNAIKYRYIRFRVTGGSGNIGGYAYFAMSEFDVTELTETEIAVTNNSSVVKDDLLLDTYLATAKSQKLHDNATTVALLDAQIADQQAAKDKLYAAMNNTAALKANLKELIDNTQALYDKMADDEGNVNSNYSVSALENQDLVDALAQITAAQLVFEDASATVESINTAYETLNEKYQVLLEVENANVAATIDKSELETLINNANTLVGTINGNIENNENYYAGVDGLALAELSYALSLAQDAFTRYYLTEEQYTNAYNTLNSCYTVTDTVVSADVAKDDLKTLIDAMEDLLATTTVNGVVETGNLALQVMDETAPFYIWTDDGSYDVENLIDENDGVANTESYLGTDWGYNADPYTHYIEVDLGVNNVLENLSLDYTTRNSTHTDERPTGLKIYGSSDKSEYALIKTFEEGLATGQCEKWIMSEVLNLETAYRYIRIAVTSSRTDASYHMSDFNLYSHCIATVNEFYSTSEIFDCLPAAMREYCDAKEAVSKYLIADDCTAAKEQLQAQIAALQAIINGNVTERNELGDLADDTEELVTKDVATVDETETVLTMQCTDVNAPYYLYCNADGTTHTTYPSDANGVEALLDIDTDNHLHTTYEGEEDDDLDHYLRLDMGKNEAMMSFKFSYTGRVDGNGNAPKTMVIEGSNDLDTFDVIATLTDLPTTDTKVTYTTPSALGNGKAYRYIRFMVTETKNNNKHDGHPYFVLSQFSVTACKTIEVKEDYALNLPLATLVTANNEVVDANAVVDCETYVTQDTYNTALAELQAAKGALETAIALKNIPVKLTTDVDNPVLYKIKVKSNENLFTYDGKTNSGTKKPVLAADELGNRYQAWYFIEGDNADSYDDVLIMPYYNNGAKNTTLKLGYANINGATEPVASESGASSYNWYITFTSSGDHVTTEGWWNLQPENGTSDNTFVNQEGGSSSKTLSFWKSANNPDDPGSQFQFVLDETDYSLPDSYYLLYNLHNDCGGEKTKGDKIGQYAETTDYNAAYNAATVLLENRAATDEEYTSAYNALSVAFEALKLNLPVEGGLYIIKSANSNDYSAGKQIYVDANNNPYFADAADASTYIWQFEPVDGGFMM
ncbi:MAG: discoidin domain-containing protein, partial [Bacteroidaceae bacterium]|nr:discoidin domain-containing protein [Bacteroidaceae bacterium]